MTEYIEKEQALMQLTGEFPENMSLEKYISHVNTRMNNLSPADVIERSEYYVLYKEHLKAIHRHTECLKELHEYRSKIDKAIAELEDLKKHKVKSITSETKLCIEYDTVMEILKRNIGE